MKLFSIRSLHSAGVYREALDKLSLKYRGTRELFRPDSRGESLSDLESAADAVSREIAASIAANTYRFESPQPFDARIDGKVRRLFRFPWRDRLIHAALAGFLSQELEPRCSPCLYSYRKGRGGESAIRALRRFARAHRRARPEKRERGLYVLQLDVKDYGDSIPIAPGSRLWEELRRELSDEARQSLLPWIERALAPCPGPGLPTGSPLVPPIDNLYLFGIDRALQSVPGACYARYGDDLLFASPSFDAVSKARDSLLGDLKDRGLTVALEKERLRFWNGAGRASPSGVPGTQKLTYLGKQISFEGDLFPRLKRKRALVSAIESRLIETTRAARARGLSDERVLELAAFALRNALDPSHPFAIPQARELLLLPRDSGDLREFRKRLRIAVLHHALGLPRSLKSLRSE